MVPGVNGKVLLGGAGKVVPGATGKVVPGVPVKSEVAGTGSVLSGPSDVVKDPVVTGNSEVATVDEV